MYSLGLSSYTGQDIQAISASPRPVERFGLPTYQKSSNRPTRAENRGYRVRLIVILGAIAALILPTPALAQAEPQGIPYSEVPGNGGWWVQKPPERFTNGKGIALVTFTSPELVIAMCGGGDGVQACAWTDPDGLKMQVMPDPCAPEFAMERYAQLQCHESSHNFADWRHETE